MNGVCHVEWFQEGKEGFYCRVAGSFNNNCSSPHLQVLLFVQPCTDVLHYISRLATVINATKRCVIWPAHVNEMWSEPSDAEL